MAEAAANTPQLHAMGDRALVAEYGRALSVPINARVRAAAEHLLAHPLPGMTDVVPAFAALTVHFDPLLVAAHHRTADPVTAMRDALQHALAKAPDLPKRKARTVEIPVCYGGEFGEDLALVAQRSGLSEEDVVQVHSGTEYYVYTLGFLPGFAYLGGLDRRLVTPRLESPRKRVPAGSVGIGGDQTGVYPFETPGGWNLIGRTPIALFRFNEEAHAVIEPGDRVRFLAIGPRDFQALRDKR
ncbi:MAG: 5-oxoprolinase subunit PxpB [Burkholderiales bacterium]|nr:5-oxoprolinase subunit PxpB [Burkholderiales bacterium]